MHIEQIAVRELEKTENKPPDKLMPFTPIKSLTTAKRHLQASEANQASEAPVPSNAGKKIDDPTTQTKLADSRDHLMYVNVRLPNGKTELRPYEIHLPKGAEPLKANEHLPVVFLFDGTTANKPYTGMAIDNGINNASDLHRFIAVYPLPKPRVVGIPHVKQQTIRDWNGPGIGALPTDSSYNDVDYVKAVIADVNKKFHPQHGYHAVGFSMGGQFVQVLDAELPKGTFKDNYLVNTTAFAEQDDPRAGISAKIIEGERDPIIPNGWGISTNRGIVGDFLARMFQDTRRTDSSNRALVVQHFWSANGLGGEEKVKNYGAYRESVFPTKNGTKLVVDEIYRAGHFWYGRQRGGSHETVATDSNGFNPPPQSFNCTTDMAKFFGLP